MYKINQIVKVVVTGWTKYGVFVNLKDGYTGMIHISELDTAFVNDIGKYVTNKEEIFAKIMSIDEKNKHVNLSVKCMNYRNTSDFDETISGFRPLYEKLPRWMDFKKSSFKTNFNFLKWCPVGNSNPRPFD